MPVFLGWYDYFRIATSLPKNMFVALGQAKISIFHSLVAQKAILLIPLALILPHFMGVAGVYAAEAISDATAAICCTFVVLLAVPQNIGKNPKGALCT